MILYSNQSIYNNESKCCYKRNHGYIYDDSHENPAEIYEPILANNNISVFSGAAVNLEEIAIIAKGYMLTIIKKGVSEYNGYIWDKVRLADGTEGYIISSSDFTVPNDVVSLDFGYNTKNYELKFSPSFYGIDIEDYPYYVVSLANNNGYSNRVCVVFSRQRIRMYNSKSMWLEFSSTDNMLVMFFNLNGTKGARNSRNRNIRH